jgi:hypothetical protein
VMLGELGVKGKGFCSTKVQISIFSLYWACSGSDRLLVGTMNKGEGGRWKGENAQSELPPKGGTTNCKADTDDGWIFFSRIFLSLSTWLIYGTHVH